MIASNPEILSDNWMIIGRQVETPYGGKIDLLAIEPDGSIILIELKRERTPREVTAQVLDYATFVETLDDSRVQEIYSDFQHGRQLTEDFKKKFNVDLDKETINQSHQILIVASVIDESTKRIVSYLSEREIPINVMLFQVFEIDGVQLLSRAWMIDAAKTQVNAAARSKGPKEPWNREHYVNFGHGDSRAWQEARKHGFVSAGGGVWYSGPLSTLEIGDRIWVKAPGHGFVGVGRVQGKSVPAKEFVLLTQSGERPALEVLKDGTYHRECSNDPDKAEHFVKVNWLQTLPLDKGIQEPGMFGITNTVAKPTSPRWGRTVEKLKSHFPKWSDSAT